jgi:hypothetical protein
VEQNRDLTNRNRIGGRCDRTSWLKTAKSISTKGHSCKSGRCAGKAVGLTPGGLYRVRGGLREPQGTLIAVQESAEGIVDVRKYIEGLNGMERRVGACISWMESGRK